MSVRRRTVLAVLTSVLTLTVVGFAPPPALAGAGTAAPLPCLLPPLLAPVLDRFREPPCEYCAGNRGIELGPAAGTPVAAGADGRVTFSGRVAGIRYVVVEHADGFRTTYGRLAGAAVAVGQHVGGGETIGTSTDRLFFGLRHHDRYLDPARALATVRSRPQLVPLDGRHRRPPRTSVVSCPGE